MKVRLVIATALALVGASGDALTAGAHDWTRAGTPKQQRTHPSVSPRAGGHATTFRVRFRLRQAPGHQGVMETSYRIEVASGMRAGASCSPPQPPPITSGRKGDRAKVALPPTQGGWCTGRYQVTVVLEQGPYCPPPTDGPSQPCPEFATRELATGKTHFTVR